MTLSRLLIAVLSLLLLPSTALADRWYDTPPDVAPVEEAPPVFEPLPPQIAPVVLKIPTIGVDASVFPVGEDVEGAMDVPPTPDTVAWWSLGPGTGVPGNVVLAAHVDWGGRLRVFGLLHHLGPGDWIVLVDEQLREYTYEVIWNQWVAADGAPVEAVFDNSDQAEVTLITCGGEFDRSSRQYLDRLIVRAVLI
jgi:Sortase domain